jgi:hypothetical protein
MVVLAAAAIAGEGAWFDMDNCAMCRNLTQQEGLLENMSWETHSISNGMVAVASVKADYMKAYNAARMGMAEASKRLQAGEVLEKCAMCNALGECIMMGVNQDYVKTTTGDVWIVTSDNKETVAKLQKWATRNMSEMPWIQGKTGHEGHDH